MEALIEDGLGSSEETLSLTATEMLPQFCGEPPEVSFSVPRPTRYGPRWKPLVESMDRTTPRVYTGVRLPPKDPELGKIYLELWRTWWKQRRDDAHLERDQRGAS